MVLTLAIPIRKLLPPGRHDHDAAPARTWPRSCWRPGLIVAYGYVMEAFIGLVQRQSTYEQYMMQNRMFGPYAAVYWLLILCNILIPQVLWIRKVRSNMPVLFVISLVVHHRHVAGALRDRRHQPAPRLPAVVVGHVHGTFWDYATYCGHHRLLRAAMFLFIRVMPVISIFEMRMLLPEAAVAEPAEVSK